NICFILKNFCGINEFKNIIFCWVLATSETQKIILQSLKNYKFNFYNISLICDEKTIYKRLLNREIETYPNLDYEKCKLQISELFDRSRKIINSYSYLDTIKIDVSNLSSDKTVQEILKIIK
ncbi:MAG: hypothetical protein IJ758_01265, partial [Clostridia bacterium]|nr:hypothetical protein [Clostridia bacterium]